MPGPADDHGGPAGEGGNHKNPNRPIPNRPGGSLIGRIGTGSDYFQTLPFRADRYGAPGRSSGTSCG